MPIHIRLLALLLVVQATTLYAQTTEETLERKNISVTPNMGYLFFEQQDYENSAIFGLRLGYDISPRYSFEIGGGFSSTSFGYRVVEDDPDKATEDVSLLQMFGDFYYNYPLSPTVTAFGSIGLGILVNNQESRPARSDPYFSFGGGLKFFVRPDRVIRLELRQYSPDLDLQWFDPRSGNIIPTLSESPRADVQKIIAISLGFSTYF